MSMGGPSPITQAKLSWDSMKGNWRNTPIQTVVFHGTKDLTVKPINGDQTTTNFIIANDLGLQPGASISTTPSKVTKGKVDNGHQYTIMEYNAVPPGVEVVRHVIVDGMAHAWSGGSSTGTYADPKGPSMSQMLVDLFLDWGETGIKQLNITRSE